MIVPEFVRHSRNDTLLDEISFLERREIIRGQIRGVRRLENHSHILRFWAVKNCCTDTAVCAGALS
jgi:hypothetical protein